MPGLNKRCVLNTHFLLDRTFAFINFVKQGGAIYAFDINNSLLDAQGYAINNSQVFGKNTVSQMLLPFSSDTTGPYVLSWTGKGRVELAPGMTWTVNAGLSSGYSIVSNGLYDGTDPYIVVNLTDHPDTSIVTLKLRSSDPDATGNYLRDLKFYFLADEADLEAGKVFRTGWKQTILDLNPGCIRVMNWTGGSDAVQIRWSNRCPPDYISYANHYVGPAYPASTGTSAIAVASASGMPVSMQHGEVAAFGAGYATDVNTGARAITAITKANPGVVTTDGPHYFSNGDKVVIQIGQGTASMHQLHWKVATVANVTSTTFELSGINTTSFTTFDPAYQSQPGNRVSDHVTLNVGGRGAYPVLLNESSPAGFYFNPIGAADYVSFTFDKYIVGDRDVGPGAWLMQAVPAFIYKTYWAGVPFEVCVALVNELNDMKVGGGAINLWICIPPRALMSVDPDYTSGENLPVNAVNVCLNGGGGWAGLDPDASLLVEHCNETWNIGGGFSGTSYMGRVGQLRYGGGSTPFTTGQQDISSWAVIRSIVMCQDLATAFSSEIASGRLIRVAAGQGAYLLAVGGTGVNEPRVFGNTNTLADAWNIGGTAPYTKFETFAWASYFDVTAAWYGTHLATYTANFVAAAGDAPAQEAICADWITNGTYNAGNGEYGFGITYAIDTALSQFATVMDGLGKTTVNYEGGYNWSVLPGGGLTADDASFMTGLMRSQAWADAQKDFCEQYALVDNAYHPSIYIQVGDRWSYTHPHYDTFLSGVEGAALNLTWAAVGEYNNAVDGEEAEVPAVIARPRVRMR